MKDVQIIIPLNATIKLKFYRAHSVLFALNDKI